jgi:hypothetical protein
MIRVNQPLENHMVIGPYYDEPSSKPEVANEEIPGVTWWYDGAPVEDRPLPKVAAQRVNALDVIGPEKTSRETCCSECGGYGVTLYSHAFGPWFCWDCDHQDSVSDEVKAVLGHIPSRRKL